MRSDRKAIDMGFTKERFPEGTHMCLIYNDDQIRNEIIGQFLAKGVELGEQVCYFTDTLNDTDHASWIHHVGMDIKNDVCPANFNLLSAKEVYYPSGRFASNEMISRLCGCYDQAISTGFTGARGSGEMSWVLRDIPGADQLIEYEALINTVSDKHPITPICQYDTRLFDGATILNVLKVHPYMIVQGQIVHNPYFVTPDEYFREHRAK